MFETPQDLVACIAHAYFLEPGIWKAKIKVLSGQVPSPFPVLQKATVPLSSHNFLA